MGRPPKELDPTLSMAHGLGAELRYWRTMRDLSQAGLGRAVHHSGALVGKVEKGERAATLGFCGRADAALDTRGVLTRLWWAAAASVSRRVSMAEPDEDLVVESVRWVDDMSEAVKLTCCLWSAEVGRRTVLASAPWVPAGFAIPFASWRHGAPDVVFGIGGRRVGQVEVDTLWAMCGSFADADHRLGGGYARSTLVHYLNAVVAPLLLNGAFEDRVGRGLLAAAARLCNLCAFMSFDSVEQGLAQRYFVQALRLAHASGDRALSGHVLGDMSMQAHHLGDTAGSGCRQLHPTATTAKRRRSPTSTRTSSASWRTTVVVTRPSGRAHAQRGDAAAAARSRLLAEQRLDTAPAGVEPRWIQFFTPAQLAVECQYIASDLGDHDEVKRIGEQIGVPAADMQRRRVRSTLCGREWPLGEGVVHGDAWLGNLLVGRAGPVLGDWDRVAWGPREVDLVPSWHATRRYGRDRSWTERFASTYGYDLRACPLYEDLMAMRDLAQLPGPLRRAPHSRPHAEVLRQRLGDLMAGDDSSAWRTL